MMRLCPSDKRPRFHLDAEQALLCACMTWPLGPDERASIARLAACVADWSYVRRLIVRHRVGGLACHALGVAAGSLLPETMRTWCKAQIEATALLELTAGAGAHRAITQLADAGIAARLIKGPAVSLAAFGRLGLRTNRDIDILVAASARADAAAVIAADGWRRVEPEPGLSEVGLGDWLRNHKDFVFRRDDGRMLELHWRLFDNDALLPALERCPVHHVRSDVFVFPTLPPTENLLYLCVHGTEHAWSRLKWLADAAALFRQMDGDDLERVIEASRRYRVYPAVAQAILLSADYLGLPVDEGLERRLRRDPRARVLARIATRSLFRGGALELEQQRWGSTLKNVGHYLMASGARFWLEEARFDLTDLSAAGLPEEFRRFGLLARGAGILARIGGFRLPGRKPMQPPAQASDDRQGS